MKVPHTEIRRLSEGLEKDRFYEIICYDACDERLLLEPKDLGIDLFSERKNRRMSIHLWISQAEEATHVKDIGRSEAVGLVKALVSWFELKPQAIGWGSG